MIPLYEMTDGESFAGAGHVGGRYKVPYQSIVKNANPDPRIRRFNPFRDIQAGGTLISFRGKNHWVADRRLIGKILKYIFQ